MNFFKQFKLKFIFWGLKPMIGKLWSMLDGKKMYLAGAAALLDGMISWIATRDSALLFDAVIKGLAIIGAKSALTKVGKK
jgi:hypothetical protein